MDKSETNDLHDLLSKLDQHRAKDETIVFTNGCFDILHRGHVTYLQAARDLGDLLVIGVNTDASVKRLKGDNRPVNNEDDRAFILQSLACVDYVIKFGEDTPRELLSQIKPSVLVKGGDYKLEEVVGREFAQQVVLIDFVDGYSTTKTIQKMKETES